MLAIKNLHVSVDDKKIIRGLDLEIPAGKVVALMGPNGSGKSTMAYTLAGHPNYIVAGESQVFMDTQNLLTMSVNERAKAGLFLVFQHPVTIPGVTVSSFLRQAYQTLYPNERLPLFKFRELVKKQAHELGVKEELLNRYVNDGFSGGEKKRLEILAMRILKPKYVVVDEVDSGLDVDALKTVATAIRKEVDEDHVGCLVITHYQRILEYLKPDQVHVMVNGKIVQSGGTKLVRTIEKEGYKTFQ